MIKKNSSTSKYVLIVTTATDRSSYDVSNWIRYYGYSTVYVQNDIAYPQLLISNQHHFVKFCNNSQKINIANCIGIWYRRGDFIFNHLNEQNRLFDRFIAFEDSIISRFIDSYIFEKGSINRYNDNHINKLDVLRQAANLEINIPKTYVCNTKTDLIKVFGNTKIITKSISEIERTNFDASFSYGKGTIMIDDYDMIPERFTPSLFQEYINKKIEIRSFYLKGNFYTMAIFSQANEMTKIDFRNYDSKRPNRCVPFKVPIEVETKLTMLMNSLEINCGSIDMIYTPQNEYVFLEVYPIGQFLWLSRNCNYFIERNLAQTLIRHES